MSRSRARRIAAVALPLASAVLLTGCAADVPAAEVDWSRAAASVTDGAHGVPTATALFPGARGIRLPDDAGDRVYGAVDRGGRDLVDRDGRRWALSAAVLERLQADRSATYATAVYEARIEHGAVAALTPRLTVSPGAILRHEFAGRLLTGTISARRAGSGTPSYAADPTLPVVIRIADTADDDDIDGEVLNADRDVAVGGRTFRSLRTTEGDPLRRGFTERVALVRIPSMHAPFDDELVLAWNESSSGMGQDFYPSVATTFGRDPIGRTWTVVQHGSPDSGPSLNLALLPRGSTVDEG